MLNKVTDRIFIMPPYHKTDRPALGLVCGDKYSLIIDSGISPNHAKEFLNECSQLNTSPLKYLVLTHHHYDHILGTSEMNLLTIAHKKITEEINKMKSYKWDDLSLEQNVKKGLIPEGGMESIKLENEHRETLCIGDVDLSFTEFIKIDLGSITCEINVVENPHFDGSVLIYIPEKKVLFMGDCIYGRKYNGIYGYNKEKYLKLKKAISSYDADYYVIAHEESVLNNEMIEDLWLKIEKEETFY